MARVIALVLGLVFVALPGHARQISAGDPDGLLTHLTSEGIQAQLTKDDYGDPKINVRQGGTVFSIYFYGCQDALACTSLQFFVGYRTDGAWTIDQANAWNKERRYTRAYISEEGSARLEMDLLSGTGGISVPGFAEHYVMWVRNMVEFEELIGW